MSATGVTAIDQQVNSLAATQPDVTLLLDRDGVIKEATLSQAATGEQAQSWLGRPWSETLSSLATDQVRRFLADATEAGVSAIGPLTQTFPSGLELPMEYTAVRLGKRGSLLAVGKCVQAVLTLQARLLAAQHGREQDYWRLREVETRYRLLFDSTNDAVVMLEADTLRIADANPAALRSFGFGKGHDLMAEFALMDRTSVLDLLQRVREQGRVPGILVHMGTTYRAWTLRASLIQNDQGAGFLLQFARVGAEPVSPERNPPVAADAYIDRLPDGFLIMDRDGVVRRANPAFVELTQNTAESALVGQNICNWLNIAGTNVLLSQLHRYGSVQAFSARVSGVKGTDCAVEISAAGNIEGEAPGIAMVVRPASARAEAASAQAKAGGFAAVDRIGAVPLNRLVQEATEAVERECIEAALAHCGGNRSAASILLGLSRQSLYVKLNRYGIQRIGDPDAESEADPGA